MKSFFFIFIAALILAIPGRAVAGYDGAYVGDQIIYKAKYEDTFVHLARDYNLGFTEMRAANPDIDPWIPGKGTKLILPTRHLLPEAPREGIVINLPEMRLYAFVNGDEAPITYPLGIGREGLETPVGTTKIVRKQEGPIWRPTKRMREEDPELPEAVYPGPENPMGTHALYLGWPQYAIHGTNRPFGIGRRISSGCIRLYPEAVIKIYDVIDVGTKVTVVDQPIKVGWIDDRLYLEAHVNVEQTIEMEELGVVKAPKLNDEDLARIMRVAGKHKDRIRWPAVRMAVKKRAGYPVEIARRLYTSVSDKEPEGPPEEKIESEDIENALSEIYPEDESDEEKTANNESHENKNSYRTLNQ